MQAIAHDDMRRIIGFLPEEIITVLRATHACLAGGYIRSRIAGEEPSDIDLFETTSMRAEGLATLIRNQFLGIAGPHAVRTFRTKNAHTILHPPGVPIQVIHRWTYQTQEALLQSFDFTVAQACIWFDGEKWQSLCANDFYPDLAAKRLRYLFPDRHEDAGGSLLRACKFLRKGYSISPENLAAVIARLLKGVEDGATIWKSGEVGQAAVLGGLLRQVDPLTVIAGLQVSRDSLDHPVPPEPLATDVPADPERAQAILDAFKIEPYVP